MAFGPSNMRIIKLLQYHCCYWTLQSQILESMEIKRKIKNCRLLTYSLLLNLGNIFTYPSSKSKSLFKHNPGSIISRFRVQNTYHTHFRFCKYCSWYRWSRGEFFKDNPLILGTRCTIFIGSTNGIFTSNGIFMSKMAAKM